jgi:hypothetical protein
VLAPFRRFSRRDDSEGAPHPCGPQTAPLVGDDSGLTERNFTLEEANAALAQVRPLAEQIVERRHALARALEVLEQMRARVAGNGGNLSPLDIDEAQNAATAEAAEIARCVQEITGLGAQVKDLELGLIDFPARRDDEEILLCWRVGEEEIAYWHGVDEGFAGRKALD